MSFSFVQTATSLIDSAGYGGLAVGLVIDSAGIPVPSEVLIPLAVVAAKTGRFHIWLIVLIGIAAQLAGSIIAYEIGRRGGLPLLERYGKYVLIFPKDLARAQRLFERRGDWYAGVGRCVPFVRGVIGFVAGIAAMPFGRFVMVSAIGSAIWTGALVAVGLLITNNLQRFDRTMSSLTALIAVIAVAVIIWWIHHNHKEAA